MKAGDQSFLNYYFTIPFIYCNSTLHVRHTVLTKEESIHRSALREKEIHSRYLAHCLVYLLCRFPLLNPNLCQILLMASNTLVINSIYDRTIADIVLGLIN